MPRDLNVWRELEPLSDGFVPAVPRRYVLTRRMGQPCNIVCTLSKPHPSLPGVYQATATFAHNVYWLCRDWVNLSDLREIEA